ncbi:MAG: arsenate reductase, glutathione/glutaredoxin type [Coleofasciculus sp. C2-GNP5-27]
MKRVIFVCQKNSCRSQMAEGFARFLDENRKFFFASAGLEASQVHPLAVQVMAEVGIDISQHQSKLLSDFNAEDFPAVISMCDCGKDLPEEWLIKETFYEWRLDDPHDEPIEVFRQVRDEVERQVKALLLFLNIKG